MNRPVIVANSEKCSILTENMVTKIAKLILVAKPRLKAFPVLLAIDSVTRLTLTAKKRKFANPATKPKVMPSVTALVS